jgi:uncharacterized pyridoxal phosphate-containing UPF0001 family protein
MRRKLADNLKRVRERIQRACERSKRPVESVRLVAVTKTSKRSDPLRIGWA